MPNAVIEAKYINMPQPGKKMGSIKAADGTYYGVAPEMVGSFKQGGVYEIFFENREYQGKTYHTIKTFKASENAQTAPAAGKVLAQAERARTPEGESKQIFVCALLVAGINAGQVNLLEGSGLMMAVENALVARELLLGQRAPIPKTNSQAAPVEPDDMEDSVPF